MQQEDVHVLGGTLVDLFDFLVDALDDRVLQDIELHLEIGARRHRAQAGEAVGDGSAAEEIECQP